ncbi:MAG TPA: DUF6755 family protein [Terriglobales bacterium]|nr:DUF6755 family protein [Terriglobales bacterium]
MREEPTPSQKRGLTGINGALALIILLLIVQIWLISATLETYLAGFFEAALPAAIVSGLIFLACAGLYLFIARLDSEARG